MTDPVRDRPSVPETYQMPDANGDMVEWDSVRKRLEAARNYWVVTANEAGSPHATPLWGAWVDDRFYLEGDPRTVWARNIGRNPRATIHLDDSDNVAIVYGTFTDIPDVGAEIHERILTAFDEKYEGYRPPDPNDRGYYVLMPTKAFAWTEFPRTATRFRWPEDGDTPET